MVRGALDPWGGVASNGQRRRLNGPHIFAADVCHCGHRGRGIAQLVKLEVRANEKTSTAVAATVAR